MRRLAFGLNTPACTRAGSRPEQAVPSRVERRRTKKSYGSPRPVGCSLDIIENSVLFMGVFGNKRAERPMRSIGVEARVLRQAQDASPPTWCGPLTRGRLSDRRISRASKDAPARFDTPSASACLWLFPIESVQVLVVLRCVAFFINRVVQTFDPMPPLLRRGQRAAVGQGVGEPAQQAVGRQARVVVDGVAVAGDVGDGHARNPTRV
jgi:hypothetical protein